MSPEPDADPVPGRAAGRGRRPAASVSPGSGSSDSDPAGEGRRTVGRSKEAARRLRDGLRQRVRAALTAAVPDLLPPAGAAPARAGSADEAAPGADRGGIVVGFSGGSDSTVLLHLVVAAAAGRRGEPRRPVIAAHLDHALRPDSPDQARFAAAAARALGVPFVGERRAVAKRARRERLSPEAAGRAERLDFLAEAARARGAKVVALGHTASDQAETVLLQLARGAGGLGLGAMPPVRDDPRGVRIVRPLLSVTRAEVAALAAAEGWPCYADPSNDSPDFTRNRVRREILPLLRETVNPSADRALARSAALLRDDEAFLAAAAASAWREIAAVSVEDGRPVARVPAAGLREAPPALARRLVREGLAAVRGHLRRIERAHIEAVRALAAAGRGGSACDLPGARVSLDRGVLTFAAAVGERGTAAPSERSSVESRRRAYNAGRLTPEAFSEPARRRAR